MPLDRFVTSAIASAGAGNSGWQAVVDVLGVIYTIAWGLSFYPQVLLNYRRKTTSGLSLSFTILNPLGFLAYTVYTLSLSYSPRVRAEYAARHRGLAPEVAPADIAFAVHALLLSTVNAVQVAWYRGRGRRVFEPAQVGTEREPLVRAPERSTSRSASRSRSRSAIRADSPTRPRGDDQHVAPWLWVSLAVMAAGLALGGALVRAHKMHLLDLLYWVSYIKLYISIAKWLPQLWSNYTRRSTRGFAIGVVALDLLGSLTSLLQLVVGALALSHDAAQIWGNPVKLGLSAVTIAMDATFVAQRAWYGPPGEEGREKRDEGEGEGPRGQAGEGAGRDGR